MVKRTERERERKRERDKEKVRNGGSKCPLSSGTK